MSAFIRFPLAPLSALVVLIAGLGSGCSAPSLHSIVTADAMVDDRGLAGAWVDDDGDLFVHVQRTGPGTYVASATVAAPSGVDKRFDLDVSLVELGGRRFADLTVANAALPAVSRDYGEMVLYPHEFSRIRRRGDTLTVWPLDAEVLQGAGALQGTVLPGDDGGTFVLTSPTAALQRYVTEHATDPDLYQSATVLHRVRKPKRRKAAGTSP